MDDEIYDYVQYILSLVEIKRPKMPSFPISAYTESEYISAINEIMNDFSNADLDALKYI